MILVINRSLPPKLLVRYTVSTSTRSPGCLGSGRLGLFQKDFRETRYHYTPY